MSLYNYYIGWYLRKKNNNTIGNYNWILQTVDGLFR